MGRFQPALKSGSFGAGLKEVDEPTDAGEVRLKRKEGAKHAMHS
jgi:hypothetical protein